MHAPTQALAASQERHSCDLIARRRSSCVSPPHSYTHAASTDGVFLGVTVGLLRARTRESTTERIPTGSSSRCLGVEAGTCVMPKNGAISQTDSG